MSVPPDPTGDETIHPPDARTPVTIESAPSTDRNHRFPQIEGYRIVGELGQGGMGQVYLAHHLKLNRMVALKMLLAQSGANSDATARFLQEARSAAALQHPHIVQVYDLGELDGQPFFAMEYLEGGHLGQQISTRSFHHREAAELVEKLARAVHYAHARGVIHRDLKPGNILLTRDGFPKIADFGLAKSTDASRELTKSGAILGTPGYLSPEQAAGNTREVGVESDVFSLGVILYELMTGKRPFDGYTEMEIVRQVIDADPISPGWHRPAIPRDLETICLKCLNKRPRARYPSANELAEDLSRYLSGAPIKARRVSWAQRAVLRVRRHPARFLMGMLAITVAAAATYGLWYADAYVWKRLEYYEHIAFRENAPLGVQPISPDVARQRATNFEFTRVGRLGKVTQIRNLNNHLVEPESGSMQRIFDGLFGNSIGPSPTRAELFYDEHDRILIERLFDRLGYPLVESNFRYPRDLNPQAEWDLIIRFAAPNNQELRLPIAVAMAKIKKNADGLDHLIMFTNAYDQPRRNGDGVFGYQMEYYPNGFQRRVVNVDAEGHRMPNRYGFAEARFELDDHLRPSVIRFYGLDGEPTVCRDGYHALVIEHDAIGNPIRQSFRDLENQCVASPGGCAVVETDYEDGDPIEMRILNEFPRGHESFSETINRCTFDRRGRQLTMWSITNGQFDWLEESQYEGEEVVAETTWNDLAKQSLRHVERFEYDENRLLKARRYFDHTDTLLAEESYQHFYDSFHRKIVDEFWLRAVDPPVPAHNGPYGCGRVDTQYHENGFPRELVYSRFPESVVFHRRIERFDDQGRLVFAGYVDKDSQPIDGPDGFANATVEYGPGGVPESAVFRQANDLAVPVQVVITSFLGRSNHPDSAIQEGDAIVEFNGAAITSSFQLQFFLEFGPAVHPSRLTVMRHGMRLELEIPIQDLALMAFRDQVTAP